jgi:tRNA(Arg) A34 adenosine deaminase TadA
MQHAIYIRRAIELAERNIDAGGGPFGAVIVKDGQVIAEASNQVTRDNDPTAHAEIMAIREAGRKLNNFDLSGCTIYTSCEPCPMCLGAIYWARISEVWYASDREDAEAAGFDDSLIYEELSKEIADRKLKMVRLEEPLADALFRKWIEKPDKERY